MILTTTLRGVVARIVRVSATRYGGLAGLRIQGLAVAAEREARVRVSAALARSGRDFVDGTSVACDAGGATIDGTGLDLALAMAVVGPSAERIGALGELSLAGEIRPVRGALAAVEALMSHVDVVLVAAENADEAALVEGANIVVVRTLVDALAYLEGRRDHVTAATRRPRPPRPHTLDMSDIRGQARARRALEIAAAGEHNVLFVGGPGAGKTMLARRLPGILPGLSEREALEVTRVHSAAGLNVGGGLVDARPFRAPHHSTTPPGLIGGGAAVPRPGEVSLAHHGVLFLDELPELSRAALEVLREPIETGEVVLARASGTLRFPSRCLVVASMAPCPCGRFPNPRCRCDAVDRARYRGRVPPRTLELFDLRVAVPAIDLTAFESEPPGEASATIAARVAAARERARPGRTATSDMLAPRARSALARALDSGLVSARDVRERVMRVARTIADLAAAEPIGEEHIDEAIALVSEVT